MVKFACAGWGFREKTLKEYFELVSEMGIRYVEVNCAKNVPHHLQISTSDKEIQEILNITEEAKVKIVALAGCNDFTVTSSEELRQDIENVKRLIDTASRIGAEVIRLFAGWISEDDIVEETYWQVSDSFNIVGEYAEKKGIKLAIENHGGITATAEQMFRIMRNIKSPAIGINYDPANFLYSGEDPLKALREISRYVIYSHFKDCRKREEKLEYCGVGEGIIDWRAILEELNEVYDGYYAIEYERASDVVRGTKESLVYMKRLLKENQGQG